MSTWAAARPTRRAPPAGRPPGRTGRSRPRARPRAGPPPWPGRRWPGRGGTAGWQQDAVMVAEAATNRLLPPGGLGPPAGPGQAGQHLGSRSPATSAAAIARPDTPKLSLATTQGLLGASSSRFAPRGWSAVRPATRSARERGRSPQPPARRWRHQAGPQQLPLGQLGQPPPVPPVSLGPPRQLLAIVGIHQPGLEPVGLQQAEDGLAVVAGGLHHPRVTPSAAAARPAPAATGSSSGRT
jgi:hypothetical protein